jgi:hypothetical protein
VYNIFVSKKKLKPAKWIAREPKKKKTMEKKKRTFLNSHFIATT